MFMCAGQSWFYKMGDVTHHRANRFVGRNVRIPPPLSFRHFDNSAHVASSYLLVTSTRKKFVIDNVRWVLVWLYDSISNAFIL